MTQVGIANLLTPGGNEHAGVVSSAASTLTAVDPGLSANTVGVWAELIAATKFEADGVWIQVSVPADADEDAMNLIDIGIGATDSEIVLIERIMGAYGTGTRCDSEPCYFPVHIPAGTRLAARAQSNATTKLVIVGVRLVHHGVMYESYGDVETLGAVTADSGGTSVDPGGTTNTKGSWVPLGTPTIEPKALILMAAPTAANFSATDGRTFIDVGAGATPDLVIADIGMAMDSNTDMPMPHAFGPFPYNTAGSLELRAQCSTANGSDRLHDWIAYVIG